MEHKKITHFLYTPFTGLGLYGGSRGNAWLKNRIQIFKQFVIPSLLAQTSKNFILWVSWRFEEKNNSLVKELKNYLDDIKEFPTVFTYSGVCFWDDKFSDDVARSRLLSSLHGSIGELLDTIGEAKTVLMTIQPSDDLYHADTVRNVQSILQNPKLEAVGFDRGYICNYQTKEVKEYNPTTNPPFFTIKFPRDVFADPLKHAQYISIKKDIGKYKAGTPYPSHEYLPDALTYGIIRKRGFVVGCHSSNISTHFNIPFAGEKVAKEALLDFGIYTTPTLKIRFNFRKIVLRMLPYRVQRKLGYWFGELLWSRLYKA